MEKPSVFYEYSIFQVNEREYDRFNELVSLANQLKRVCEDGEELLEGFVQIVGDIWYAFYALNPIINPFKQNNQIHGAFIQELLEQGEYQNWHAFTKADSLLSVLTTITIGEQLHEFLKQDKKTKKSSIERKVAERKYQHAVQQLEHLSLQSGQSKFEQDHSKLKSQSAMRMAIMAKQEKKDANKAAEIRLQQFNAQLTLTLLKAKPIVEQQKAAIVAFGTIDGKKIEQVPLKEQFTLAEQITEHPTIQAVAEMAGRFKKIAKKKMKSIAKYSLERKNISMGSELSRLIPLELANYVLPVNKQDFLRRYVESQAFVFDTKGKDHRGRGPIIICMDESSSMYSIRAESKAFCLALLMIAKRQKRDFAIVPFSSEVGTIQLFPKGKATTEEMLQFSHQFMGGGTNYEKPLRESLAILLKSEFNDADVLFVTDGSSFLPTLFIDEFNELKKKRKFECTSIVLTNLYNVVDLKVVERFSDKVIEVNNLFEADEVFALS